MNHVRFPFSFLWFLAAFAGLAGCAESPRALPGFQPLVIAGQQVQEPLPMVLPIGDQRRRAYEESLPGRVCYYAKVVDQHGQPVPDAMVMIILERLGHGTTSYFKCRTTTDAEGRFSVVGGTGTHVRFRIIKAGFSPDGRRGALRGDTDVLRAGPESPETISLWKNTGADRKNIVSHHPLRINERQIFEFDPPLPKQLRFDLVRGVIAKEGEEWDVAVEYTLDDKGNIPAELALKEEGRYVPYYHIVINNGKMAYMDEPLPGFARPNEGAFYYDLRGVFEKALVAEKLPYLNRAENQVFQFKSRGGRVHGSCAILGGVFIPPKGNVSFRIYSAVNATGSPALFEYEPTKKDLSTDNYPLSE